MPEQPKTMNLDAYLTPFPQNNSKWTVDLNVKCEAIKLIEDNIGDRLGDPGYGNDFLKPTPK